MACKQLITFDHPNPLLTPVPRRPHPSCCVEALSRLITPANAAEPTTHHGGTRDTKCFAKNTYSTIVFLQFTDNKHRFQLACSRERDVGCALCVQNMVSVLPLQLLRGMRPVFYKAVYLPPLSYELLTVSRMNKRAFHIIHCSGIERRKIEILSHVGLENDVFRTDFNLWRFKRTWQNLKISTEWEWNKFGWSWPRDICFHHVTDWFRLWHSWLLVLFPPS